MKSTLAKTYSFVSRTVISLLVILLAPAVSNASGELKAVDAAGKTVYAEILSPSATVGNGTSFETENDAHWSTYKVALAEQGTSQVYSANLPSYISAAGRYSIVYYEQIGGSPAPSDTILQQSVVDWTGSAVASEGTNTNSLAALITQSGNINSQTSPSTLQANTQSALTAQGFTTSLSSILQNHQMGRFRYTPSTHLLQLYLDDGTTTFGSPMTLSLDASSNILSR